MEFINELIFFTGILLCISIIAVQLSHRIGAPLLLSFLSIGILFGEDGIGGVMFDDMSLSYGICSFTLAIILFDGGIHTPIARFKKALRPASILATLGVLLTALITGIFAYYVMNVPLLNALLFGSIVASTDAAAVFLLLRQRGISLHEELSGTLEVESGINDPMAIFLTITLVEIISNQQNYLSEIDIFIDFIRQIGLGILFGCAGGRLLSTVTDKLRLEAGLYPIFAMAGGLCIFGATNLCDASGFLAIYIAGLFVGNLHYKARQTVKQFMDGMAWLAQLTMLLLLGLLVTPSNLVKDIPNGILIALVLIFIARPIAVNISLIKSRFKWREKLFISWVGLRGAIPIYLAIIPVLMGLQGQYFNLAFIVVVSSLLLQGWSIKYAAKWLNVEQIKDSV